MAQKGGRGQRPPRLGELHAAESGCIRSRRMAVWRHQWPHRPRPPPSAPAYWRPFNLDGSRSDGSEMAQKRRRRQCPPGLEEHVAAPSGYICSCWMASWQHRRLHGPRPPPSAPASLWPSSLDDWMDAGWPEKRQGPATSWPGACPPGRPLGGHTSHGRTAGEHTSPGRTAEGLTSPGRLAGGLTSLGWEGPGSRMVGWLVSQAVRGELTAGRPVGRRCEPGWEWSGRRETEIPKCQPKLSKKPRVRNPVHNQCYILEQYRGNCPTNIIFILQERSTT